MADPAAVISAVAAVVSAIGGAFAAIAAFRSAASAREASQTAEMSEKRAALRQLIVTANEVVVEARRADSRGAELKLAYRTLFTFGGSSGGSRETKYLAEVEKKLGEITTLSKIAKPFASDQDDLMNGLVDEISGREASIAQVLTQVRAIREDLEREHASVEGQNTTYREKAIRGTAQ
jgi:replicative DNA helicase